MDTFRTVSSVGEESKEHVPLVPLVHAVVIIWTKASCSWHNDVIVVMTTLLMMRILMPVAVSCPANTTLLLMATDTGSHTGLTDWTPVAGDVVGVANMSVRTCW